MLLTDASLPASPVSGSEAVPAWYCARSLPKREMMAVAHLKGREIEAFCPRIRVRRKTGRGYVWFTEALFPAYVFVHFSIHPQRRSVETCPGIRGLVHFGEQVFPLAPDLIAELENFAGVDEIKSLDPHWRLGDSVTIADGPLANSDGQIYEFLPGAERVRVLVEMLGGQRPITLRLSDLVRARA